MTLVLIADDEEPVLDVLSDAARSLGHDVVRALDGEEALVLARSEKPDLVITDQMMPRRTGTQLIAALRDDPQLANVPVILMSAMRPKGAEAAWLYLPKPIQLASFEHALNDVLAPGAKRPSRARPDAEISSATRALEEMLRWIAHEIKTPLSAAQMASQLLEKRLETIGDESDRKRIGVVLRQLSRMNALVTSVLDAARLADGRVQLERARHDLVPFLERVVADWREIAPGHRFDLEAEPVSLSFDAERVRQILDNLLSNAVKYGAPGNHVTVSATLSPGLVAIRVTDRGAGIDAVELPRVFDRFHRTEVSGNGHGLGLYIASMLARLHGGTLTARSTPGQGSTFCLSLPQGR